MVKTMNPGIIQDRKQGSNCKARWAAAGEHTSFCLRRFGPAPTNALQRLLLRPVQEKDVLARPAKPSSAGYINSMPVLLNMTTFEHLANESGACLE